MTEPRYHVRPERGWLNDPNGPIRWGDRYHLFYQHNPAAATHGNIHWGHVSGTDLLGWDPEPIALSPRPGGPDAAGCWSGCVVDDGGVPTAVYTGARPGSGLGRICLARGDAELRSWAQDPRPVVAGPPPDVAVSEFRDPFVFRAGGRRFAVVGMGGPAAGAIGCYSCDDLTQWEWQGILLDVRDPVAARCAAARTWECPQLFPVRTGWMLVLSLLSSHGPAGVAYLVGDLDADGGSVEFRPRAGGPFDAGTDCYAPAVLVGPERTLAWGWSWEAPPPDATAEPTWAGVLTFPREVDADGPGMVVRPARELAGLRGAVLVDDRLDLAPGAAADLGPLPAGYELRVDLGESTAAGRLAIDLLESAAGDRLTITADRAHGVVGLDRAGWPSTVPRAALRARVADPRSVRVFVDGSILELFVDDRVVCTERVYPRAGDVARLRLAATGATVPVRVVAWALDGAPVRPS